MIRSNLHTHSTLSDGKNTPEEMILRAKELSFVSLGFSDHSEKIMFGDATGNAKENLLSYRESILELKKKYEGEIKVFCGIEKDAMTEVDNSLFDYIIGSVHFIEAFDEIVPIDLSPLDQLSFIEKHGRGEKLELAKRYFDRLVTFSQKDEFDILGHFDLVNKFSLFDEEDLEYQHIAKEALVAVLENAPYIEVNTGAIARGYRTIPYPCPFLLSEVRNRSGKVVVSSDAHFVDGLNCFFDHVPNVLKEAGFSSYYQKTNSTFEEIPLIIET